MRCTVKKTFQIAADAGIALIVQIKDNQLTLHRQVRDICASAAPLTCVSSIDKGRNREERRTVAVFDPRDVIADPDWRACIAAIVRVERDVFTRSAKTGLWEHATHSASYLSNTPITADRATKAIRAHWTIENTSHYTRDVTMGEDASRIRFNPGVFARLRSFGYNILKANRTGTLAQDRYRAALGGLKPILNMVGSRKR